MELVIFIGLPASGKSSFYRERFAATHALVSKDLLRDGRRQLEAVRDALARGESVVVDNTNPRRADRAPLIALARAAGAQVSGYWFTADPAGCLERNRRREGRARVPAVAIWTARKRLEPPTTDEGFDRLFEVSLGEEGFAVAAR